MVEMELLAHRGFWTDPSEKNSPIAFKRALESGYGIETDLRDLSGTIVISHDPPVGDAGSHQTFEEFLALYRDSGSRATLALNVKSDGLAGEIFRLLVEFEVHRYFVFDMSIPDMLGYAKIGMRCFSRQSEFESPVILQDDPRFSSTAGIWLDSFSPIWYSTELIGRHLSAGLDVCLVSPELHGRKPGTWWDELREFLAVSSQPADQTQGRLMLCTDFPNKF